MTKDDVTRLAHEAGGFDGTTSLERPIVLYAAMSKDFLDKFADLVAKQEREACAKVCLEGTDMPVQVDALKIIRAERERISNAIRASGEKPPVKSYCGGKPNYCTPVDAVPEFTVTEPRQSLSRMKPGDRFVLVRTGEICRIKNDGSQWNETAQRPSRFHKNSQVRLIVDAVNMSQDHVDETAKGEHVIDCTDEQLMEEVRRRGFVIRDAQIGREWVGLTDEEKEQATGWSVEHIEAKLREKNNG